jgi:hypothetical protein
MIPVALLGSVVYLVSSFKPMTVALLTLEFHSQSLRFVQTSLSHEKYLDDARSRIVELEAEVEDLRKK